MSDTKRTQVVELVREKDRIEAEIHKLRDRDTAIDARIDALLKTTTGPTEAKPKVATTKPPRIQGKKRSQAKKKPVQAKASPPPQVAASPKPAKAPAAKKPKTAKKPAAKKPKTAKKAAAKKGPLIKDRLLALLRAEPKGVDLGVLAKAVYGSDAKDVRARCEAYLYNLAKDKLVGHEGATWQIVPAAAAS